MKEVQPTVCKTPRWQLLKASINNLDPEGFKTKMENAGEVVLIDVRTPEEFAINPLPNALNIDYLGDGFWDKMEELTNDKTYLVYCRTGRRSMRTCTLMKNGGFDPEKVFNLDGGMVAWEAVFGL
ncbi:MAG: rhodanese-like domain-containing protein [Bacteroidota bacterium]